jgi:hypothetical protein
MHFERRYGTQKEAVDYCKKKGLFEESGNRRHQGQRTDLILIREQIKAGVNKRELLETYELSASQLRVIDNYYTYLKEERNEKPNVLWIHGPTGSGKTKYAFDNFKDMYVKEPEHKWWDGYDGHKTILIDDLRCKFFKFAELLRILDRYPKRLEIKGGFRQLSSQNIIITCPCSPQDLFKVRNTYHPEDINQLTRRIDQIIFLPPAQSQESGNTGYSQFTYLPAPERTHTLIHDAATSLIIMKYS